MATDSSWKCPNCGYSNASFDTECFSCKKPRPNGLQPQGSNAKSSKQRHSSSVDEESMTAAHWVVMVLLLIGAILFCTITPLGKQMTSSIHFKLPMNFSTTSFDKLTEEWSGFAMVLCIGGLAIGGLCGGFLGAIAGLLCGAVLFMIICFIWSILVNFVFPLIVNASAFALVGAICLAFALGCSVAIVNYARKFILYLNPYPVRTGVYDDGERRYYEDKHKRREEYGRRSYFFGPGFFSIKETIRNSWKANFQLIGSIWGFLLRHTHKPTDFLLWIPGLPYAIFFTLSTLVVGSAMTFVCSLLHAVPILLMMLIIGVLFSATWMIDRIYLQIHSIKTNCPYDQIRVVIPVFECPACGNQHKHLVPGPYGIWHRKCSCGQILPTTFLMGRSALKAFCPNCGHELAASDAQQFAITLIGGSSSGKTVLISAFYHEFFKKIDENENVTYEIPDIHADMFRKLEEWYSGENCDATTGIITADPYSIILKSKEFAANKQFSLYDIPGEMLNDPTMSAMLPQQQMRDSDGVVLVIDPLSALAMRNNAKQEGDDTSNYSKADAAFVTSNFITYLKTVLTNGKIKQKSKKPVAVVITKSDLSSVSRHVSYHTIKNIMRNNPGSFENFADARDTVCREFLINIGLEDAVKAIEEAYSNIHFYPVSAIGHAANGEEFDPVHVMEPFYWLINDAQAKLIKMLDITEGW